MHNGERPSLDTHWELKDSKENTVRIGGTSPVIRSRGTTNYAVLGDMRSSYVQVIWKSAGGQVLTKFY